MARVRSLACKTAAAWVEQREGQSLAQDSEVRA